MFLRLTTSSGHHEAWKKAGVLHCDISVGNIMIKPRTREGFLIDWDLARFASELCIGPVKPDPAVCDRESVDTIQYS